MRHSVSGSGVHPSRSGSEQEVQTILSPLRSIMAQLIDSQVHEHQSWKSSREEKAVDYMEPVRAFHS